MPFIIFFTHNVPQFLFKLKGQEWNFVALTCCLCCLKGWIVSPTVNVSFHFPEWQSCFAQAQTLLVGYKGADGDQAFYRAGLNWLWFQALCFSREMNLNCLFGGSFALCTLGFPGREGLYHRRVDEFVLYIQGQLKCRQSSANFGTLMKAFKVGVLVGYSEMLHVYSRPYLEESKLFHIAYCEVYTWEQLKYYDSIYSEEI